MERQAKYYHMLWRSGTDIRDILEAKMAALEESAGQLKALAEMQQRIAEDTEAPPKNSEKFRQKALEHKQGAIAALTAANTLKVVLTRRTKAQQIAVMRHYVLEFGQGQSRNARVANSLDDNDPQKEEVEQSGISASLVVAVLNGILSDIAPPPFFTEHSSMAGRLGLVLSWTANLIALAVIAVFLFAASWDSGNAAALALVGAAIAAVIWLVGRGLRYVLTG